MIGLVIIENQLAPIECRMHDAEIFDLNDAEIFDSNDAEIFDLSDAEISLE